MDIETIETLDGKPRVCANAECGRPLYECMGICKAGDVLQVMQGQADRIRELCEKCSLAWQWTEEDTLVRRAA